MGRADAGREGRCHDQLQQRRRAPRVILLHHRSRFLIFASLSRRWNLVEDSSGVFATGERCWLLVVSNDGVDMLFTRCAMRCLFGAELIFVVLVVCKYKTDISSSSTFEVRLFKAMVENRRDSRCYRFMEKSGSSRPVRSGMNVCCRSSAGT